MNFKKGDKVKLIGEGRDKISNGLWMKEDKEYLVVATSLNNTSFVVKEIGGTFKTTILSKESKYLEKLM